VKKNQEIPLVATLLPLCCALAASPRRTAVSAGPGAPSEWAALDPRRGGRQPGQRRLSMARRHPRAPHRPPPRLQPSPTGSPPGSAGEAAEVTHPNSLKSQAIPFRPPGPSSGLRLPTEREPFPLAREARGMCQSPPPLPIQALGIVEVPGASPFRAWAALWGPFGCRRGNRNGWVTRPSWSPRPFWVPVESAPSPCCCEYAESGSE
jgi:hypothetical protein